MLKKILLLKDGKRLELVKPPINYKLYCYICGSQIYRLRYSHNNLIICGIGIDQLFFCKDCHILFSYHYSTLKKVKLNDYRIKVIEREKEQKGIDEKY